MLRSIAPRSASTVSSTCSIPWLVNRALAATLPYNIEKTAEDAWCIVLAVAGFTEAELNITQKEDELLVTGKGRNERNEGTEYLYRGIGARDFERRFQLADHVRVTAAKLENGLLSVELQRELPEEKKPRAIPIEGQSTRRRITQQ